MLEQSKSMNKRYRGEQ